RHGGARRRGRVRAAAAGLGGGRDGVRIAAGHGTRLRRSLGDPALRHLRRLFRGAYRAARGDEPDAPHPAPGRLRGVRAVTGAFDLAIAGSGFGGSLLAMVARRLDLSVLLLERGAHPRFAIGESTSPLTNLLLEELAQRYDLPRLLPLASYG